MIADRLKPGTIFERSGPGIFVIAQKIGVEINSANVMYNLYAKPGVTARYHAAAAPQ